ncbi:SMI1/KNR4 family protein [Paenalcaligenes suwonensis]|uniref:SMI1/KNR4 family protein n=1 Tax=Paenalcaligenes suwonensis TaxID=1202713 RepID=UPI001408C695|nr:SMI1/KNR4 family protein [Paenalcaligenes suwonensis]NHC59985.1 SMI1/KNR4 family protein [Paenalcaligenes suwonensis]
MLSEQYLCEHYSVNPPALLEQIQVAQSQSTIRFPQAYVDLLLISNGLSSDGCLALHGIDALPQRNADYEVAEYLPDYFMIGDDSGGQAIVINESGEIFEVGMGVMSQDALEKSADSIADLLINHQGLTLGER